MRNIAYGDAVPVPSSTGEPRVLLRDRVFARLREAIVDGTLEPGERLNDADLCRWLGVSRTPVREALGRLEQTGLVQVRPGSSTLVSPLDDRAAVEAQAVVATLHELAAREAVPLVEGSHLEAMEQANDDVAAALRLGDVEAAVAADAAFHQVFVDVCANRTVIAVLDDVTPLLRRMERARFATLAGRGSVSQHREIVAAARRGDADAAAAATRANWLTLSPPS